MKVLVVGAGAYVTGRGTDGPGTVIPALAESSRSLPLEEVVVAATRQENDAIVRETTARVNAALGTSLSVRYERFESIHDRLAQDPGIRAAIVAVPDPLHAAVAGRLLEAGLHVLLVKPMAPTVAEARRLETLRAQRDLFGMVEFHKRWDEANLVVKRLLDESRLGRISYFSVEYSQRRTVALEHFRAWAAQSNIFQYLGVHYVDLVYFLTGFLPRRAMAVGTRGLLDGAGIRTWDSVHALVEWEPPERTGEGFVSQFATNWIDSSRSTAMSDQKFRIIGERGRIECDQKNRGLELTTEELGVQAVNPYFSQFLAGQDGAQRFAGYGCRSFATFLDDVLGIEAGRATPADLSGVRPTFRQALVSTAVIEAVNTSLASDGAWIGIDAAM